MSMRENHITCITPQNVTIVQFLNIFKIKIVKYSSGLKLIYEVEKVNYATLLENKICLLKLLNQMNCFLTTCLLHQKISNFLFNGLVVVNTGNVTNDIIRVLSQKETNADVVD